MTSVCVRVCERSSVAVLAYARTDVYECACVRALECTSASCMSAWGKVSQPARARSYASVSAFVRVRERVRTRP
eukprot:3839422-Pleurochrysis_carterae.AAC.1